ncbi:hypothetical protein HG531_011759 [Fusarium graminearum]|nr:hypothetical protein HG531_011759 [Fusarium graminearum]
MRIRFPSHSETLSVAEICNLKGAAGGKKQILNTTHHLLEETIGFLNLELPTREDEGVEISTSTELHYFTIIALGVLEQVKRMNDVGVSKGRRYAKFGCKALAVLLFCLFGSASELLDSKQLFIAASNFLVRDANNAERATSDYFLTFAVFFDKSRCCTGSSFLLAGFVLLLLQSVHPVRDE